jgi:1,4-alpha-glucan branching enzyme
MSRPTLESRAMEAIVRGEHGDPFAVLGPHRVTTNGRVGTAVRAFVPDARAVRLVGPDVPGAPHEMTRVHTEGLFEVVVSGRAAPFAYRLEVDGVDGKRSTVDDPYRFATTLGDYDRHLLAEGTHYEAHERLGAHLRVLDGVAGTVFAVWAPNARRVSVVGDFNGWDGRRHPMRLHPANGIWEVFAPGVGEGERYKYEIITRSGEPVALKADPYAFAFELDTPRTASVVTALEHQWSDGAWMAERGRRQGHATPIAIYEVHLGSWARAPEQGDRFLTYQELAERLAGYVKDTGFTHVELLPVTEHPFYGSWGYQTIGYFAPTRRFGAPRDFMTFVDTLHRHGIGVILDWVPAHFPRDPHGLVYFDGTHLYEHADPRQGEQPDWGTLVFNYGRSEVANFLLSNALFWLDHYHVDGLRVDAVASMLYLDYSRKAGEWVPNRFGGNENLDAVAFLKHFNEVVYARHPDVMTFAEESTSWPMVSRPTHLGGLGFGFKWNMGWMHDLLGYMSREPVHRKHHQSQLSFGLVYAFHENFALPLSHDEVVHGKGSLYQKMPGDAWQKAANLRAFYGFMYGHPGKKLLFMGGEFGQTREWSHDRSLDWHLLDAGPFHLGLQRLVRDLNGVYRRERALHEVDFEPAGFEWVDSNDWQSSVVAFLRRARDPGDVVLVVSNFTPVVRSDYRVGVPRPGRWRELVNTDADAYGGSGQGNAGGVWAEPKAWHGRPHSLSLTLPPLSTVILKPAEAD